MERKIGEIFEYNGEWYQCMEGNGCENCAFKGRKCYLEGGTNDPIGECCYDRRRDNKDVVFKKLEKVGEPYMAHDHSRNKDVVVQDYKLYNQHACYNGHEEMLSFGLYGRVGMVTIKSKEPIKSLNCENSVEIEIKQNKEDMEENKDVKQTPLEKLVIDFFNNRVSDIEFEKLVSELYAKHSNSESIGMNLRPFDIQKAREGKPVCTRDGRKARIICFDYNGETGDYPIVALVNYNKGNKCYERVLKYTSDGLFNKYGDCQHDDDLMMLPEKKEGWAVIRRSDIYETEEQAKEVLLNSRVGVMIRKIEWEE